MATIISHDETINTTNLSLKSLAYKNKQLMDDIEDQVAYNKSVISTVTSYNTVLNNIVRNLQAAAKAMINIQKQLYSFRGWSSNVHGYDYGLEDY